jgi:hypothetical protein
MNSDATQLANQRLWKAHPELKGRQIGIGSEDASLRAEWVHYYKDATKFSAPTPAVAPTPATPPPPRPPVITSCTGAGASVFTADYTKIKDHVQEGDIVLRGERGHRESDFLAKAGKCDYSHAGIVVKNDEGELVVVDAFPSRGLNGKYDNAVQAISVDCFFGPDKYDATHGLVTQYEATHGMVTRPKDCVAAEKAAEWAMEQTKDPDYVFSLFDPWNENPKKVYCADFVHQAYQNAGVELVKTKMDFLGEENKANTIAAGREFLGESAKDSWDITIEAKMYLMARGTTEYITPCQVGTGSDNSTVLTFDSAKPPASSR